VDISKGKYMTDELQVVTIGFKKEHKTKRIKRERVYLCSSELQKMQCGVEIPSKETCREGCPFIQVRLKGQGLKRERLSKLENRLVNFEAEFDGVIGQWARKQKDFLEREQLDDAYIIKQIIEILCEPDLRVAQRKLTSKIFAVKKPLFRDYYRTARDDVKTLRKVIADHQKVMKLREKNERRPV